MSAEALAIACRNELDTLDVSEIRTGRLYLSEMATAASPLALALLGIKAVVIVSHGEGDSHVSAGPAVKRLDTSMPLANQLPSVCSFLGQTRGAALICSATGRGVGAAVCAAVLAAADGISTLMALEEVAKRRGAPLRVELDEVEELGAFCDAFLRMEFRLRLGEPATSGPLSPSTRSSPVLTPPFSGVKRPAAEPGARSPLKQALGSPHSSKPKRMKPGKYDDWPASLPPNFDAWRLDL